jgi:hypothetical protein
MYLDPCRTLSSSQKARSAMKTQMTTTTEHPAQQSDATAQRRSVPSSSLRTLVAGLSTPRQYPLFPRQTHPRDRCLQINSPARREPPLELGSWPLNKRHIEALAQEKVLRSKTQPNQSWIPRRLPCRQSLQRSLMRRGRRWPRSGARSAVTGPFRSRWCPVDTATCAGSARGVWNSARTAASLWCGGSDCI